MKNKLTFSTQKMLSKTFKAAVKYLFEKELYKGKNN